MDTVKEMLWFLSIFKLGKSVLYVYVLTPLFCLGKVVCVYRWRNSLSSWWVKQLGSRGDVPGGSQANGTDPWVRLCWLCQAHSAGPAVCYTELGLPRPCDGSEECFCLSHPCKRSLHTSLNWEGSRGWLVGIFVCLFHPVLPCSGDNSVTWRRMYGNNKAKQLWPSALYLITVGYLLPHHWEDAPSLLDSVPCQTWRHEPLDLNLGLFFVLSVNAA